MKNLQIVVVFTYVLSLSGCSKSDSDGGSGDDGVSGVYTVTSQMKNSESCEGDGTSDPTAPAFYRIFPNSEIFPGAPGWSSETCTVIEECKDDDLMLADIVLNEKKGDTWTGESIITAFGGSNCSVTITNTLGSKQADGSTLFTQTVSRGMKELAGDDCDPDSPALADRSFLTCRESAKIVLTRIP